MSTCVTFDFWLNSHSVLRYCYFRSLPENSIASTSQTRGLTKILLWHDLLVCDRPSKKYLEGGSQISFKIALLHCSLFEVNYRPHFRPNYPPLEKFSLTWCASLPTTFKSVPGIPSSKINTFRDISTYPFRGTFCSALIQQVLVPQKIGKYTIV